MKAGEQFNPYRMFQGVFIPNGIVKLSPRTLSNGAKICYGRLAQYAGKDGEAYPSRKVLAEAVGVTLRQVHNYVRELENFGLIRVIHPKGQDKLMHKTARYAFLWHSVFSRSSRRRRGSKEKTKSSTNESEKSNTDESEKFNTDESEKFCTSKVRESILRESIFKRGAIPKGIVPRQRGIDSFYLPSEKKLIRYFNSKGGILKLQRVLNAYGERVKVEYYYNIPGFPFHELKFDECFSILHDTDKKYRDKFTIRKFDFTKWSKAYRSSFREIMKYLYSARRENVNYIKLVFRHYIESRYEAFAYSKYRPLPRQLKPTPNSRLIFGKYIKEWAINRHGEGESYWISKQDIEYEEKQAELDARRRGERAAKKSELFKELAIHAKN